MNGFENLKCLRGDDSTICVKSTKLNLVEQYDACTVRKTSAENSSPDLLPTSRSLPSNHCSLNLALDVFFGLVKGDAKLL